MAQVGRISGPLLFANLERQGIDLAFRNDLQTNQLLYLDVANNRIGVDLDSPARDLEVSETAKTVNLITDFLNSPNFSLSGNTVSALVGNINLSSSYAVSLGSMENDNLFINDNTISSISSNSSIDLYPNGSGSVEFLSDTNVQGNLLTPGNIQLDGTINLGNEANDTVDFNSDLDSDLIPDESNSFTLGTPTKRWKNTFTRLLNGESVTTTDLTAGQIDFNLRQGNIFYVAENGDDAAYGDHPLAPFRSVKRALEAADASIQGPVAIFVFPGEYSEQLPLVVPNNVSLIGTDIRSTIIKPSSGYEYSDVFLLDGDTTVENVTVKDFYFENNSGYAFRFRPNGIIQSRSPYINNVTVITKGSETSNNDPRGFESADAGRGALIDGAELDAISNEASMLFHSCTFITPGVDAITMTNGVRVEWMSSFIYFANRGLYAFNNSTGRVTADGSTVKFGAEVRSISSANIYGNIGAEADGDDCLMYLIKHNFAYIGSGKSSANDKTKTNNTQETVESNNGKIVFTSIDHIGTYRVGDVFFASFEKGETSISGASLSGDELTDLRLENNGNETFFDYDNFFTGNIQVNNNLISSFIGPINIDSPVSIELKDSTNIGRDLSITGDLSFGGNLNLFGNEPGDTVDFNTPFSQDFVPNTDCEFKLGSDSKRWKEAQLSKAEVSDIEISDNVIQTVNSNSNLDLRANGSGKVRFSSALIDNDLTLNGTSFFQNTNTDNVAISENFNSAGNLTTLSLLANQEIIVDSDAQFENIRISNNVITTTDTNSNLELIAAGSGEIFLQTSAQASENLLADNISSLTLNASTGIKSHTAIFGDYIFSENNIKTSSSSADVDLAASGTGNIRLQSPLIAYQNLSAKNSFLSNSNINGTLDLQGKRSITDNFDLTGNLIIDGVFETFNDVVIEDIQLVENRIESISTNNDLVLKSSGSGLIRIRDSSMILGKDISVRNISVGDILLTGTITLDELDIPTGNIEIDDNYIQTDISNSDLELRANGTGAVNVDDHSLLLGQNLVVDKLTNFQNTNVQGLLEHSGTRNQTGSFTVEGLLSVSTTFTSDAGFESTDISIVGNKIYADTSNADLELSASQTGKVLFAKNNVLFSKDLFTGFLESQSMFIQQGIFADLLTLENITIDDNFIATTSSNSDLELRASGSGSVVLNEVGFFDNIIQTTTQDLVLASDIGCEIAANGALQIPKGSTGQIVLEPIETLDGGTSDNASLNDPTVDGGFSDTVYSASDEVYNGDESIVETTGGTGDIRFNTDENLFEGFQNATVSFGGIYSDDRLSSVLADPTSNVLKFRTAGNEVGFVTDTGLNFDSLKTDDIQINDNKITTSVSNSNLDLQRTGTGEVNIGNLNITDNRFRNLASDALVFDITGLGYQKIQGTAGVVVPSGTTAERPAAPQTGETRWNTTDEIFELWDGSVFVDAAGTSQFISEQEFDDLITEYTLMFG